jgi:hypothetical protein
VGGEWSIGYDLMEATPYQLSASCLVNRSASSSIESRPVCGAVLEGGGVVLGWIEWVMSTSTWHACKSQFMRQSMSMRTCVRHNKMQVKGCNLRNEREVMDRCVKKMTLSGKHQCIQHGTSCRFRRELGSEQR